MSNFFAQIFGAIGLIGMEIGKRFRGWQRRRRAAKKDQE